MEGEPRKRSWDIYWAFIQGVSSASPEDALGTERSWENAVVYGDGWGALGAERSREDAVVDGGAGGDFQVLSVRRKCRAGGRRTGEKFWESNDLGKTRLG
eukprot:s518_g4.t1